jgi:hypothetical protein
VELPCNQIPADHPALADVIDLGERGRIRTAAGATPPEEAGPLSDLDAAPMWLRDADMLGRRYGDRWRVLPSDLGRAGLQLEALLSRGPTAIDPEVASPKQVVIEAWLVVRAAATQSEILAEEAEVLGEALGADLAMLDLRRLDLVVGAVIDLGLVRSGEPSWADPAEADVAVVMLDANGPDLRRAADLHHDVYGRFTEDIWAVSEARLRAGRQGWRIVSRMHLRRDLSAARRPDGRPHSLSVDVELLLEAREARRRLVELSPLLERHLGRHYQGPLTEVDSVQASLDAIVRLQGALGRHLDVERLRGLLLADAFTSPEVANPALTLHTALRSWAAEVARLCGGDPWAIPAGALAGWARRTGEALPMLTAAMGAVTELGLVPTSLRHLVDDLVLREHLEAADQPGDQPPAAHPALGASEGSAS